MPQNTRLFIVTHWLLKAAIAVNFLAIAGIVLGMGAILIAPDRLGLPDEIEGIARADLMTLVSVALTGGLVCTILILFTLRTIAAIIDSAISGDPFIDENSARLMRVGWLFLAVNLMEILTKFAVDRVAPESIQDKIGSVDVPVTGLLAVLLTFVLAQIFRRGSAMRAELEGTV